MGWLTGPREHTTKQVQVIDGRQAHMPLNPFGAPTPNLSGELQPDGTYANYAVNGYGRNELVYACIRYRAESLPQSIMRVYPVGGTVPNEDHRLRKVLSTPNEVTDEFAFWEMSVTYKDIAGTSFWLVVNGRDGLPSQIWPLRPDLVGVLPGSELTQSGELRQVTNLARYVWIYRPDPMRPELFIPVPDAGTPGATSAPAYMLRVRYPNPNPQDPGWMYFGQPPLRAGARATSLDNAATDFTDSTLRNHAMPAVIIETENEITEAVHKRLKAKWIESFGGSRRGEPAFFQKGMKAHVLGMTLTDLEFPDLRDVSETRVCMVFAVEPILVGAKVGLLHNAYKDYREARLSFWEEAMFTEQRRFIEPVRSRLLPAFAGIGRRAVRVDWDNSGVLALRESQQSVWERAVRGLQAGGLTRNDFRALIGLPMVPGGDVFLTPSGAITEPAGSESGADTLQASYGMLAAEFGVELSPEEVRVLAVRGEREGVQT
jgi:phage portal protein BeeE